MMSDEDYGKKLCEEIDLSYFREAYADVTGEHLSAGWRTERPDFICTRDTGEEVVIELVKVVPPEICDIRFLQDGPPRRIDIVEPGAIS